MQCDLCGSQQPKRIVLKNNYWIVRCLDCGLPQAVVPENVEEIYKEAGYFAKESTGTTFGLDALDHRTLYDEVPLNERTFDLFNLFGKSARGEGLQEKSILEIGPSPNGGAIRYLTALSNVEGLEISEYATDYLRNLGFSMHCGSINDIRFERTFDIILAYEVVEHLKDPVVSFSNIFNHLKDGGTFIFSTGNAKSMRAKLYGKRWSYFLPPQHLFYYDGDTIAKYLEGAGFAKCDIKVNKYSLWSKELAIKLGFPSVWSTIFLRLVSNLTSGMTVYATKQPSI